MHFCPFCGTLLYIERNSTIYRYACCTCRYVAPIRQTQVTNYEVTSQKFPPNVLQQLLNEKTTTKSKKEEDEDKDDEDTELGDMSTQPKTEIRCGASSECDGSAAYFVQMQIRSADEPPTTIYQCVKCKNTWRTD